MYVQDGGQSRVQLDTGRLLRRLQRLDMRPSSPIMTNAGPLAASVRLDPRELLHLAIDRALRSNASRPNMRLVPYLTMLMWSITSSIHRARKAASERGSVTPFDFVDEQVPDRRSIVDPFKTLVRRDEQAFFERLLGDVVGDDRDLDALVDGIGFGQCGKKLEEALGVGTVELATLRRRLKRRAQAIAVREGLMRLSEASVSSS